PRTVASTAGWAARRPAIASSVARIQSAGSCSDQPACGRAVFTSVLEAEPTTVCSASISMALTLDVPRSIPRYMAFSLVAVILVRAGREVVLDEDIEADALLRRDDGQAVRLGAQHADGAAHLVAGILVEHGIDGAGFE